jgi:Chaperone of endosialidase
MMTINVQRENGTVVSVDTNLGNVQQDVAVEITNRIAGDEDLSNKINALGELTKSDMDALKASENARFESMKTYIDTNDYLNFDPLAGVLTENTVPLYSDFKFSLGANASYAFYLTDDQNFEVAFFHASTPTGLIRPFRAYRFSNNQEFIYDPEPLTVGFMQSTETVTRLYNIGTKFAYINIHNSLSNTDRRVVVKTLGSSDSSKWILFADVTSITNDTSNIFLLTDGGADRILKVTMSPTSVMLRVYDFMLTELRSQELFNSNEVTNQDLTGAGRVVNDHNLPFGYNPFGTAFAFTWNKFTENFLMKLVGYYTYTKSGSTIGQGFGTTISWNITKQWLLDGTGATSNLVPVKPSGFRYHKLPDSTWNTTDGGMGDGYGGSGQGVSVTTDEYAKRVTMALVGTWDTSGFTIVSFGNSVYTTIGTNLSSVQTYNKYIGIPDASPWSKYTYSSYGQIIDDNVMFTALSNLYGSRATAATFSTSSFSSVASLNDTLKLDPVTYEFEKGTPSGSMYSTTALNGQPNNYKITAGAEIEKITLVDKKRVATPIGFTVPSIPDTIGSVTGVAVAGPIVYNANDLDRKCWAVVKDSQNRSYIACYAGNSWSSIQGPFLGDQINLGRTVRGDSDNVWFHSAGNCCLTGNGRLLFGFGVSHVGGTAWYIAEFNVNTNTMTVHGDGKFNLSDSYGSVSGYYGTSFGFSSTFGYYCLESSGRQTSILISSSKDVTGRASEITEDEWFNGTGTRSYIHISAEPTVGLSVYLKAYPLFIGGYYTVIPETVVAVEANKETYIYAEKDPVDRHVVNISSSTDYQPSSFTKVVLGKVTTNSYKVTSAISYPINGGKFSGIYSNLIGIPLLVSDVTIGTDKSIMLTKNDGSVINLGTTDDMLWKEFDQGQASPTPQGFKAKSISGFNAYSSTDFPSTYMAGISINGTTIGAQMAIGWDGDNTTDTTAPTKFYIRSNDDTGTTTAWSPWKKVLLEGDAPTIDLSGYLNVKDNDGINAVYSDENPIVNGVQLGGGFKFGGDGSYDKGIVDAAMINARAHVNSAGGYFVGTIDPLATPNAGTFNTTQIISGTGLIMPTAGNTVNNGIKFPNDPGGGGGDTAWIRYYAYSGEKTNLEIGISNDPDDTVNFVAPKVGINRQSPNATLDVNGDILASGDITAFSDPKLKTNVVTIENALAIIRKMRGVNYDRIDTGEAGTGVLADETFNAMPVLVKDFDGTLGVNYGNFAGLFIEGIKTLEDEVIDLKSEISSLKDIVNSLVQEIKNLKAL